MNRTQPSSTLSTLGTAELARLLDKSPTTIQADVHRRPASLPPRLVIPGSKRLLWLQGSVEQWLSEREQTTGRTQHHK